MEKLFEDSRLIVQTNGVGEIFVTPKADPRSTVRIGPDHQGLILTAHDAQFTPWATHGLPAIKVQGR